MKAASGVIVACSEVREWMDDVFINTHKDLPSSRGRLGVVQRSRRYGSADRAIVTSGGSMKAVPWFRSAGFGFVERARL